MFVQLSYVLYNYNRHQIFSSGFRKLKKTLIAKIKEWLDVFCAGLKWRKYQTFSEFYFIFTRL